MLRTFQLSNFSLKIYSQESMVFLLDTLWAIPEILGFGKSEFLVNTSLAY